MAVPTSFTPRARSPTYALITYSTIFVSTQTHTLWLSVASTFPRIASVQSCDQRTIVPEPPSIAQRPFRPATYHTHRDAVSEAQHPRK